MKRWLRLSILAVLAVVLLVIAFVFDAPVHDWMQAHQSRGTRTFMENVSRFGDWWSHVAFGLLLFAIAALRRNKKWMRIFLAMLIASALAGTVARAIKMSVGRERPSPNVETIWRGPSLHSKYHAFPSGHTSASTAFFAVLLFTRRRIGLACLAIPMLIGFSRLYVGAHYLSDVVFAALLGVLCALVIVRWLFGPIANLKSEI